MADIEGKDLLLISKKDPEGKHGGYKLRVVQWIVDGESKSVKLEKRKTFLDEEGNLKDGKAEGFGLKDLEALKDHWPKIISILKNPPVVESSILSDDSPY